MIHADGIKPATDICTDKAAIVDAAMGAMRSSADHD